MSYGIEIYDSNGSSILSMSSKTIKLAADITVTTPTSGTSTVSIPSNLTPTNSIAVLDNGATVDVTSTGVATLKSAYFDDSNLYSTKLKVFLL